MAEGSRTKIPLLTFALACLGTAVAGQFAIPGPLVPRMPLVWLPVGLLAAAVAVSRRRDWPRLVVVALVAMTASMLMWARPAPAIASSAAYAVEALLAGWLLQRVCGAEFEIARLTNVSVLLIVSFAAPMVGGALIAAITHTFNPAPVSFANVWLAVWITDALGMLLGASLFLGWRQYPETISSPPRWRIVEAAAWLAVTTAAAEGIFGGIAPEIFRAPAFILPLFFIAVFRFGYGGTAAALLAIVAVGLHNTTLGRGPFLVPGAPLFTVVVREQLVAGMATVSFLLLASTVAERRRIAQERSALVSELQTALAEIKTLRGLIPICAWCHKIRDDAGFWQETEAYLQTHTEAVFSHGICPECTQREHLAISDQRPSRSA